MYVADCTTPANFFHLLRRREHLNSVLPKFVARSRCVQQFATGSFRKLLMMKQWTKKMLQVLCFVQVNSIMILHREEKNGRKDVAVVRIEQLFPLPVEQLKAIIAKYQMPMIMFGHRKNQKHGSLWLYVNEFQFSEWRLASLKLFISIRKLYKGKRRHADAIKMVFDRRFL
jgi:2-oxoglutarate dehydrogenase E1 component